MGYVLWKGANIGDSGPVCGEVFSFRGSKRVHRVVLNSGPWKEFELRKLHVGSRRVSLRTLLTARRNVWRRFREERRNGTY